MSVRRVAAALAVAIAGAVVAPTAASADGRCKPYWHTENVGGHQVPMVTIVC